MAAAGAGALLDVGAGLVSGRGSNALSAVLAPAGAGVLSALAAGGIASARAGRPAWALAAAALALALLAYALSGAPARALIFPGADRPLPSPGSELGAGARVVAYRTSDGVELRGVYAAGRGAGPRPALLFFHGNADCAANNVPWALFLARHGFDVFVAEYRGYGGCSGRPSEAGLRLDARSALEALEKERSAPGGPLVVVGRSLGTGVASLLAGEGHGDAVLLVSPFRSVRAMAERLAPRPLVALLLRDPFDSQSALAATGQPVGIVHGTADRVVPFAEGEALARALGARARLRPIEGVGHDDILAVAGERIARDALDLLTR
ncbi:MAG: alpha/beta fold hydrolase [Planctomycetota bacterium]|nr:MAG: alpha/beta fold hydrolase [Planctomycetota bacterium]